MEAIVKAFFGVFLMLLLSMIGFGLIAVSIDIRNAEFYATTVSDKIRAANYMEQVVEQCEEEAKAQGYTLTTEVYRSEDGSTKYGNLILDYDVKYPVFQFIEKRSISIGI